MLLKSKLLTAGVPSLFTGKVYSRAVLEANVERLSSDISAERVLGELGEVSDNTIHFSNVSHKMTGLWWEGDDLWGEALVLSTPMGKVLLELVERGVSVRLVLRGFGYCDGDVVLGNYVLVSVDAAVDS